MLCTKGPHSWVWGQNEGETDRQTAFTNRVSGFVRVSLLQIKLEMVK